MSLILDGTDGLSDVDGTAAAPALRGTDANTGIFFPAADTIAFATGGTEDARFNSVGNLQTIGTISVGNATPSTSGAGITFPATQSASSNANTLDDYEEGAWSPIITNLTTNVTSYFYNIGRYTKIGRSVSITMQVSVNVVGISSGNLSITGLPFPMAETEITTSTSNAMLGFRYYPTTGSVLYKIEATSNTTMGLYYPSTYPTGISSTDLLTGGQWFLNTTYFTT